MHLFKIKSDIKELISVLLAPPPTLLQLLELARGGDHEVDQREGEQDEEEVDALAHLLLEGLHCLLAVGLGLVVSPHLGLL